LGVVVDAARAAAAALHQPCLEFGPPMIPDLISSYLQHPVENKKKRNVLKQERKIHDVG
jgi:hypothetical protein